MEGQNNKGLMKAVSKLAGQAAIEVQDEERQRQWAQYKQLEARNMPSGLSAYGQTSMQPYWSNTTTTATTTTAANMQPAYQNIYGGGAGGAYPYQTTTTGYVQHAPPMITFSDDQMTSFMEKLANLLAKGWECIRCHRIWNPRETGCEFCNFIDRLEGKDVERDTASYKQYVTFEDQ